MEINVSQLLKENIGSVRNYNVSEDIDLLGDGTKTSVEGKVTLTRTNRGILVQGTLHATVPLTCSRCLCLFDFPTTAKIEEEFFPLIDVITGNPVPMPDEPGCFFIDEHHILDLTEAIRQNLLLSIPIKTLCREDCAGLCAECGRDLNKGQCGCQTPKVDARWAKLLELTSATTKTRKRKRTE